MEMEQRVGRVHRFKSRRTILVDTLVTQQSREAHVYEVARAKLELITFEMASPDRSEAVFARVMAFVPPDELLQVMGRGPLSPLSHQDRSDVERLVTAGHERWSALIVATGVTSKRFAAWTRGRPPGTTSLDSRPNISAPRRPKAT